jgi:hypothetical protein
MKGKEDYLKENQKPKTKKKRKKENKERKGNQN